MNNIEDSKDIYDQIEIPKELKQIVEKTIVEHARELSNVKNPPKENKIIPFIKYTASVAAILIMCFTIALNTVEVFAKGIQEIPIIGDLARVLTIRSYEIVEDDINILVKVPAIEINDMQENEEAKDDVSDETNQFVTDVNAEIEKIINDYTVEAKIRISEYKDAYIATGGNEEEWAEKNIEIHVEYEVKYQYGDLLSLVLTADESWSSAYGIRYYYNLNHVENHRLNLEDILGVNYKEIANESILQQMHERTEDNKDYIYWGITDDKESDIEGFTTVDINTDFYISDLGNPVICFDKYTISPGFMGTQEFEIVK